MHRLRTFGGLSLTGEHGPLARAGAQRKSLALLAVVAAAGDHGVSRDRLLASLWPESDAERARGALRQMLHGLRRQLDGASPLAGASELRLDPAVVTSDVAEFAAALQRGDPAGAVALYGGPFLDGFFLSDTPEFERWAEGERARLAARYAAALEQLAHAADAGPDRLGAVAWWRRLVGVEPLNGRIARRLAGALDAAGDRAGAIECLRVHAELLEQELGALPDPSVLDLATRLRAGPTVAPRGGDVRSAGVRPPDAPPDAPSPRATPAPIDPVARQDDGPRRASHVAPLAVLAGVVAIVVLGLIGATRWRPGGAAVDRQVIAVLPFRASGADPTLGYLREGMVD
jgi:DNA-binding SARP family transcriptional activator